MIVFFFFQAEDGIRDLTVTGVQTCALPISADLVGHNLRALVEEVLALGEPLDAIDLGALGLQAAVVNEKSRVLWAALPLPLAHQAKERLVWRALAHRLGPRVGGPAPPTVAHFARPLVGGATGGPAG